MKLQPKNKKMLLQAALGTIPSDMVLTNGKVVNVFTGEVLNADVYIYDGFISHVEYDQVGKDLKANKIVDVKGQYVIPGLIDAHVHIESSMMTPRNFAKAVIPHGTTTVITDPHEIANVWGVEGVRYMHEDSENLPMRQLIDIPSCVPAVPGKENAGADFLAKEIAELAGLERVIGLAEVMDFLAVIYGEDRMMEILKVAEDHGLYLQGHAPFVTGRMLSAYLCGGPRTDHESRDTKETETKYRYGMNIDMRDSSLCKNVPEIMAAMKNYRYYDTLCLCTDDRESDDLLNEGHINEVIRVAIKNGMDPIDAIKCSTINTAREIRMDHLGAIAPGYVADIVVLDDLTEMKPSQVYYGGQLVAEDGHLVVEIEELVLPLETRNSIHVKELTVDDFRLQAPIDSGMVKVNVMCFDDLYSSATKVMVEELPVKDGYLDLSNDSDLKFVAVVNRYDKDNIALHVVRGFGSDHGAVASTVSHDSHNLTVVYDTAVNALVAANRLKEVGGGMCAVEDGQILHTLELPIGGLLSPKPVEELSKDAACMKEANRKLGLREMENPMMRIVTLALPVIPEAKMSDLGLINVFTKEMIPLYVD
ncbi:MAG: adenine deaminase [Erysipelotrichaceae bacterium]|nr:adenine deaminase [Erysipelotrichaceae bacterium]